MDEDSTDQLRVIERVMTVSNELRVFPPAADLRPPAADFDIITTA